MSTDLTYDRAARRLTAPDRASWLRARLLQLSHRAMAPVGYFGISRVFGAINRVLPASADTVVRDGEFRFRFPADDYYWNRLLDPRYEYEPEIDRFLRAISDQPFTFLDLGANFGYWSARVAAGLYGQRPLLAVEASTVCHQGLSRNLEEFGDRAAAFRYAIADRSGDEVKLFGKRHAGFSIDPEWTGASSAVADVVVTITVDDLLREAGVDPAVTPLVVKLDVEGVEKQALQGAPLTVAGPSVFLIEDAADPASVSDAVEYALQELGMRLYSMDHLPLRRLGTLEDVLAIKQRQSRIQHTGLNIVATASPMWWEVLEGRGAARDSRDAAAT